MRSKMMLKELEDVQVLYQFLYMSPEHNIVINNGMTDLEIRLDENLRFKCRNLSFPHLPEMEYSTQMTLRCCMGAVDYLKEQPAKQFPATFDSEWEEISHIALRTMAMNFCE